jgi:hypothetical protein
MTEDNHDNSVAPDISRSASETQSSAPKKRLEDLLIDDDAPKTTFRELADQEVKSGKSVGDSLRWPLVILALLIVAVVGVVVGWYQYGDLLTGQLSTHQQVRVEKRMAAPERPQPLENAGLTSAVAITEAVTGGQDAAEIPAQVIADVPAVNETAIVEQEIVADAIVTPTIAPDATDSSIVNSEERAAAEVVSDAQQVAVETPVAMVAEPAHRVLVGPFISQRDLERAIVLLRERGLQPQQQLGSGTVDMIRLLEGIYPLAQAQLRLEELRKEFSSAFLLPDGDRWALYIGSFSDRERARRQQRELAERQIQVAQVDSQLTIEGPLLVVVRNGLKAAEEVAAEVNASGLRARIEVER